MPEKGIPLVANAAGRQVPESVNGRPQIPFQGIGAWRPEAGRASPPVRSCADYPDDGNKRVADFAAALKACGAADGMTISTHHHLRNGDTVAVEIFDACARLGLKNLVWFPSAAFPCHEPLIGHLESGVIHHIEGSLNGPLGDYCSEGRKSVSTCGR